MIYVSQFLQYATRNSGAVRCSTSARRDTGVQAKPIGQTELRTAGSPRDAVSKGVSDTTPKVFDQVTRCFLDVGVQTISQAYVLPFEDMYEVTAPQGMCLIINVEKYEEASKLKGRAGSEKDVQRIQELFGKTLKFQVETCSDPTGEEIFEFLIKCRPGIDAKHGCFVCFIMAHGHSGVVYGKDGGYQRLKFLMELFHANNCSALRHKPKLFFIQACRGDDMDVSRPRPGQCSRNDSAEIPVYDLSCCPAESDFLVCFPNVEGAVAPRDPFRGSPFIQSLCDVFENRYSMDHVEDMMTEVNRQIKVNPRLDAQYRMHHAVTEKISRLSKKCYLDPTLSLRLEATRTRRGLLNIKSKITL